MAVTHTEPKSFTPAKTEPAVAEKKVVEKKKEVPVEKASASSLWKVEREYPRDPNGDRGQDPATLRPVGSMLNLLTPKEFEELPDGTKVYDIFGFPAVKGKDVIDTDTRGGFLAYGTVTE
jgi:hypothetical protein